MNAIYQWCMNHQAILALAIPVLTFIVGWALPNDKAKKIGFTISQFIRRCFGAKLEEKIEDIVDGIDEGMKSDNKQQDNGLTKLLIIGTILLTSAIWSSASAENPFSHFLKARTPAEFQKPKIWEIKASAILPAAKLTISRAADRVLDVEYLSNAGAGLTYQAVILKDEKPFALYGVSAIVLKDLTAGLLFNFWNNTFGIGPGFTFGQLADRDKRPCIMFTMNYTFFQ
jgi:hypothetical protein